MTTYLIWVLLLAAPFSTLSQQITAPGIYRLASDYYGDDLSSGSAIITVSGHGITVDLGGNTITQGASMAPTIHAIVCTSGSSGITLCNGSIHNLSGFGIVIEAGCADIAIENIRFADCADGHILVAGTASHPAHNIHINNCSYTVTTSFAPAHIIEISECHGADITDIEIVGTTAPESAVTTVFAKKCSGLSIEKIEIAAIAAQVLNGIVITESPNASLADCCLHSCKTTETAIGIRISESYGTSLTNIEIHDLLSYGTNGEAIGFSCTNTDGCSYTNCIARSIKASGNNGSAYGFKMTDNSRLMQRNCTISLVETTPNAGNAYGIFWAHITLSALLESIVDDTRAGDQAFGMLITTLSDSEINGNQFLNSSGGTLRRGLRVVQGTRNLFTRNIAFRNGASATEQIDGLASGTTDFNTATGNISTIGSPWTNIRAF